MTFWEIVGYLIASVVVVILCYYQIKLVEWGKDEIRKRR